MKPFLVVGPLLLAKSVRAFDGSIALERIGRAGVHEAEDGEGPPGHGGPLELFSKKSVDSS